MLYEGVNRQIRLYRGAEGKRGGGKEVKQEEEHWGEEEEKGMKLRGTESILSGDLS